MPDMAINEKSEGIITLRHLSIALVIASSILLPDDIIKGKYNR